MLEKVERGGVEEETVSQRLFPLAGAECEQDRAGWKQEFGTAE
jgi:hypothetical protein